MGYRRGLSKASRLSVLCDRLKFQFKAVTRGTQTAQLSVRSTPVVSMMESMVKNNAEVLPTSENLPIEASVAPSPEASAKTLLRHWSYEKSSIAAAVIFTTIAVAALIILVFLGVRKARRGWARRREEEKGKTVPEEPHFRRKTQCQIARETAIFSNRRSPSSSSQKYMVEQTEGSVSRVYRDAIRSPGRSFSTMGSLNLKGDRGITKTTCKKPTPVNAANLARETQASPSLRPVIVTQPQIHHAVSMRGTPVHETSGNGSVVKDPEDLRTGQRLPSIGRTVSPICNV